MALWRDQNTFHDIFAEGLCNYTSPVFHCVTHSSGDTGGTQTHIIPSLVLVFLLQTQRKFLELKLMSSGDSGEMCKHWSVALKIWPLRSDYLCHPGTCLNCRVHAVILWGCCAWSICKSHRKSFYLSKTERSLGSSPHILKHWRGFCGIHRKRQSRGLVPSWQNFNQK